MNAILAECGEIARFCATTVSKLVHPGEHPKPDVLA